MLIFCAQTLCSNSVLPVLSFSSSSSLACWPLFSLHFSPGGYYSLCTARCLLLPLGHSALFAITSWAQRTVCYYLLGIPKWALLPVGHTEVSTITSYSSTNWPHASCDKDHVVLLWCRLECLFPSTAKQEKMYKCICQDTMSCHFQSLWSFILSLTSRYSSFGKKICLNYINNKL